MGRKNLPFLATLALLTTFVLFSGMESRAETIVRYDTVLGSFDVELFDTATPLTVANFLNYVNRGDFNSSFIHRSIPGFIVQGGGFTADVAADDTVTLSSVTPDDPVMNEFNLFNTHVRGTIAMAKVGPPDNPDGSPGTPTEETINSATNGWFFNLANNSSNLDNQNGGFTAFGKVLGNGMDVVDAIAALQTFPFNSPFNDIPLRNYTTQDFNNGVNAAPVEGDNFIIIESIAVTHTPEPGTLGLLAIGWLGVARRRRRIA
jgi:peptidyl-prolyl cis-trans isomerase A (cyclophilin A)